jgi:hypothetical protein
MKKYLYHILVVLVILLSQIKLNAQTSVLSNIESSITAYNEKHLPEKIYIHTDKSVYVNNEICWFKIYTVEGFFHTPLNLNKVAYVELLDQNHKAVLQEKLGLNNAAGFGTLQLPTNIPSGKYSLVAYTNWMKNFNPSFFFSKTITVINTQNSAEAINIKPKNAYQVNYFPQSGNLLNGFMNKVAFIATDAFGNGINTKGWVINNKADTICSFATLQNGIGNFSFTPQNQNNYKAIIETPTGPIETMLPLAKNNGFLISTATGSNKINMQIEINASENYTDANAYLIIHCRGVIKKAYELNIYKQGNKTLIPLDSLGDGINTITLFNEKGVPVAERLYFKYPKQDKSKLTLESDHFKKRTKVNLSLNTEFSNQFDASIAVYKTDSLQGIDEMNIQNYLLLSSDLVGKIQAPNSYFDNNNPTREAAMDNLMLTHGWRRFTTENLNDKSNKLLNYLPEIGGNIITGKVYNKGTTIPSKEAAGYLSVPSKNTVFKSALSDQDGNILFQFQEFKNEGQIIVQADSNKNIKNRIEINNPFIGKFANTQLSAPIDISKLPKEALSSLHRNIQIQQYYTPQNNTQFSPNVQDTNAFYYTPDRTYFLDDYARFTTLEEVIREYVTPVTLVKEKGKYQLYVYDEAYKQFFEQSPLVLLDGVIIKDIDKFLEYDPLKIRKLEVVSRVYFSGNLAYNGVINFTTYTGKLEGFELDPNAIVLDYKGLQANRIFNAPVYESQAQIENRLPDFRQLLYWKPDAKIGNKNSFSFYTSDLKGNYIISVQGINKEGVLLNQQLPFSVQ